MEYENRKKRAKKERQAGKEINKKGINREIKEKIFERKEQLEKVIGLSRKRFLLKKIITKSKWTLKWRLRKTEMKID